MAKATKFNAFREPTSKKKLKKFEAKQSNSKEEAKEIDSKKKSKEIDSKEKSKEIDSKEESKEIDSKGGEAPISLEPETNDNPIALEDTVSFLI